MTKTQLNIRVEDETLAQVEALVNHYRKDSVGVVTGSDVVRRSIANEYQRLCGQSPHPVYDQDSQPVLHAVPSIEGSQNAQDPRD